MFGPVMLLLLLGVGVRVRWAGGELVLLPEVGDEGYEAAQRMSLGLRHRITGATAALHRK